MSFSRKAHVSPRSATDIGHATTTSDAESKYAQHGEPSTTPALFEAIGLECVRGDRLLFRDLSLSLQPGNLLQIEGANGSGKTSLLRILCGLALPTHGEVRWQGQAIHRQRQNFMAEMTYIGHNLGVKGDLTPVENIQLACGLGRPRATVSINEAIQRVGLEAFDEVATRTLSAGQKRRVALSRLLATQAQLWILDEPLAALDIKGVALVEQMLLEHLLLGGMAVVSTHHTLSVAPAHMTRLSLN